MPKIKILPDNLRDKIRAGEVIERPASCVKELIENSIDAGAGRIDIEIKGAGRGLILVSDDGEGMTPEDAVLSLMRHSTSKIDTEDDLYNIRTMGFRGEALASIASVSRLRLITAPKGEKIGILIEAEAGDIKSQKDSPSIGTTIEVKDLFFNTPVRKKFLKKDPTELMHIIDVITRLSLSHPEIVFRVKVDGSETMTLPRAGDLRERLCQIYGAEFIEKLNKIDVLAGNIHIYGFVSKKDFLRESRQNQYIFINKRPVREPSINHAIYSAYGSKDSHPIYFLFIDMPPSHIDFNVHPTKQEVRFKDKEYIYKLIKDSVRDSLSPDITAEVKPTTTYNTSPTSSYNYVAEPTTLPYRTIPRYLYLGETFIAVAEEDGITIIDYHAAHERVLYERLLKGLDLKGNEFLFPKEVYLSPNEYAEIIKNKELLSEFSIEVEDFGSNTLIVRSLPPEINGSDIRGILSDLAGLLSEGIPIDTLKMKTAATIACHSSIRGKRLLSPEDVSSLLSQLNSTDEPERCPHGRPTRIKFTLDELKKLFKRK